MAAARGLDVVAIRPALEHAVEFIRVQRLVDPSLRYPSSLKQLLSKKRLTSTDLRIVRKAVEGDANFRGLVASALTKDCDELIVEWFTRNDGWEERITRVIAARAAAATDTAAAIQLGREQQRRIVAEQRAETLLAEHETRAAEVKQLTLAVNERDSRLHVLEGEIERLHDELNELRTKLRHTQDKLTAATSKLSTADERVRKSAETISEIAEIRDAVIEDRNRAVRDAAELTSILHDLAQISSRVEGLLPAEERVAERIPLRIPGRCAGNPHESAMFLLRSSASVLVDGYNVTKTCWPELNLEEQRSRLVSGLEQLAAKMGTDVIVIFDGADVAGGHAARRSLVRTMWSPAGVTADDVIRQEVSRLPIGRPVVVVTDDMEIRRDVQALGANLIHSRHLADVLHR